MNETLSDKEHAGSMLANYSSYFYKSDVKEAIKKLKEECHKEHSEWINNWGADLISDSLIDKIFGEELTK